MKSDNLPILDWTLEYTKCYLQNQGLADNSIRILCEENKVDGKCLLCLNDNDFTVEPISKLTLRDRKALYCTCKALQRENHDILIKLGIADSPESSIYSNHQSCKQESEYGDVEHISPTLSDDGRPRLPPEKTKAFLSLCYVVAVTWITAFVMVIVHDRVPDMKKYPPLPDIFLDNVPHIPWAFDMCEVTGTLMFTIWLIVLLFHKHRFILLRRFFSLSGTVFLLRCITMLITSLSVPGTHLQCEPRNTFPVQGGSSFDNLATKLSQAYIIWRGAGMSIQGVRTCGDYMFSGHTVALTTLNFFITEYTPRHIYYVHTLSWMMNMFGVFFILAAHEHYSIDVFVAFYITSRLFLYYHTLANNQALMSRDSTRTRVWFPLFSYFENSVDCIVPNEYDTPAEVAKQFINFVNELVVDAFKSLASVFQRQEASVAVSNSSNTSNQSHVSKKTM
ncbi:unnamed protein product [Ceutorhynchus assimilis]|uniref:Sphingomyelin synthase-like domain-containing protein n=1 Tax=Ceutorhynchus assimilis TaxID=467358 RepID=A0A9N9MM71_9CUCU|nr:unnamed protein product [Ceutorhynchus assimilis]